MSPEAQSPAVLVVRCGRADVSVSSRLTISQSYNQSSLSLRAAQSRRYQRRIRVNILPTDTGPVISEAVPAKRQRRSRSKYPGLCAAPALFWFTIVSLHTVEPQLPLPLNLLPPMFDHGQNTTIHDSKFTQVNGTANFYHGLSQTGTHNMECDVISVRQLS